VVSRSPDDAGAARGGDARPPGRRTPRYEGEWRVRHQDGSYHWIRSGDLHARRLGPGRSFRRLYHRHRCAQRSESAAISEERFALAVAASTDGIWDWDITTDAMFLSERAQHICGLKPVKTTRSARSGIDGRAHPGRYRAQRKACDDYVAGIGAELRRRVGVCAWRNGQLSLDTQPRSMVCVTQPDSPCVSPAHRDIDARKRIEEELRSRQECSSSRRRRRTRSFDGSSMRARENCGAVAELEALFGLTASSYDRQLQELAGSVHPEDWPSVRDELRRAQ